MNAIVEALVSKWPIALGVFLVGVVIAVVMFATDSAGLMGYVATSQLRVVAPAVPGIELPCSAASAQVLAKYAPSTQASSALPPTRITTELPAPGLLTIHYRANDPSSAVSGVNQIAGQLVSFCAEQTASVATAAQTALTKELTSMATDLGPLDAQAGAVKDRAALVAQSNELEAKLITLQATASDAQQQLSALVPVAHNEIEQADPAFVALQKRLNTDLDTYSSVASAYRSTYARVVGLRQRVAVDQQQVDELRTQLDQLPLELSATYRTALTTANQAQSAVDTAQAQLTAITAQIAHYNKIIGNSAGTASGSQAALAKAYQTVVTNEATLRVQLAQIPSSGPVTVLSTTTTDQVVRVGLLLGAAVSLIVAMLFLLLGIILAIVIGLLDKRLLTVKQFTKLYGKPVIATLTPKH